jgi:hypothetical protein
LKEKKEVAEKVAARAYAKSYLQTLIPTVFDNLASNGYFYEKIQSELESQILPWLSNEVGKSLKRHELCTKITDGI